MWKNSYALVTGASAGIGKAIAYELAMRKINLLLIALPDTGLPEVAKDLSARSKIDVRIFQCDLREDDSPRRVMEWATGCGVSIKILINNAGVGCHHPFDDTPVSLIDSMILLNNHALVKMTYYMLPELKRNAPAYLMNLGSLASFMAIPGKSVYSATKSFIYSFSRSLRLELRPHKISVSCLCPGATNTTATISNFESARYKNKTFLQTPEAVAAEGVEQMLMGRARIITGIHNKMFYRLSRWLPAWAVNFVLVRMFGRKLR